MECKVVDVEDPAAESSEKGAGSAQAGCLCWRLLPKLFNAINHVLIVAVTGYLCYLASHLDPVKWATDYHVILCTIGYVFLMSEAIMSLSTENLWSNNLSRRANSHAHWILQALGAGCYLTGFFVMYRAVGAKDHGHGHFHSVHSIVGIASIGPVLLIIVSGLFSLFSGTLRKTVRPIVSKCLHNVLGLACFVIGMIAEITGLYKPSWLGRKNVADARDLLITAVALIVVLSSMGALRSLYGQLKGLVRSR